MTTHNNRIQIIFTIFFESITKQLTNKQNNEHHPLHKTIIRYIERVAPYYDFSIKERQLNCDHWRRTSIVWKHQGQNQWQENQKTSLRCLLWVCRVLGGCFCTYGRVGRCHEQIPQPNTKKLHIICKAMANGQTIETPWSYPCRNWQKLDRRTWRHRQRFVNWRRDRCRKWRTVCRMCGKGPSETHQHVCRINRKLVDENCCWQVHLHVKSVHYGESCLIFFSSYFLCGHSFIDFV